MFYLNKVLVHSEEEIMGQTDSLTIYTHWDGCWQVHPDCFWSECIRRGVKYSTTSEYQAFSLYREERNTNLILFKKEGGEKRL